MKIIRENISLDDLKQMAEAGFGDMVKGVVDIKQGLLAVDAELHSDLEVLLIEEGAQQSDLWGINLYPELEGEEFLEFDSMINIRPSQNNRSRGVDDEATRKAITVLVGKRVLR